MNQGALRFSALLRASSEDYCCGAREHRDLAVRFGAVPRLLRLLEARPTDRRAAWGLLGMVDLVVCAFVKPIYAN